MASCPTLHRAGRAAKSQLNKALYAMQKAGESVVEDELGNRSLESQVIRLADAPKVRKRPTGPRNLLDICLKNTWRRPGNLPESAVGL